MKTPIRPAEYIRHFYRCIAVQLSNTNVWDRLSSADVKSGVIDRITIISKIKLSKIFMSNVWKICRSDFDHHWTRYAWNEVIEVLTKFHRNLSSGELRFWFSFFQNNYYAKYENQNLNSPDDRFRSNFVRASINSFQAYLVQWWSKSDRQIFHTFEMKIFDNYIFKIYGINISKNQLWQFHREIDTSLHT